MSSERADSSVEPLKVVLVAGSRGAGKSSVVAHLRRHCGGRLAGIDAERDPQSILRRARLLATEHLHDALIIELSSLADLDVVAEAIDGCEGLSLDAVVVVIDGSSLLADFCSKDRADALTERIERANVVVLNKIDRVMRTRREGLVALVTALNPAATLLESEYGRVVPGAVMAASRALASSAVSGTGLSIAFAAGPFPGAERFGIATLLYRERRPFHPDRFARFLDADWPGVVRARGLFWLASRPDWSAELSQSGAARRYRAVTSWWAATLRGKVVEPRDMEEMIGVPWDPQFGDRRQQIAFVGIHLDVQALRHRLDACLLSDAELSGGMESWQSYADPFPPWGVVANVRAATRFH